MQPDPTTTPSGSAAPRTPAGSVPFLPEIGGAPESPALVFINSMELTCRR